MEGTPKQYLYHMVPEDMKPDQEGREILYPLNILKEKFPGLYEVKAGEYNISQSGDVEDKRKFVTKKLIPTLENATWGDVLQLTAIHPRDLKKALVEAGFRPKELKFYQVDPELLDPEKTTIYLYREDVEDGSTENFTEYSPDNLDAHANIPEGTKGYYKEKFKQKEKPLLFVGVPHIFHKGPIDVSNFPIIATEIDSDPHASV